MTERKRDGTPARDARAAWSAQEDPDAPATPEEIAAAEALRDALEDPSKPHAAAELARAVAHAHAPRAIDPGEHRAIVEAGIARGEPRRAQAARARRGRVIRVAFVASGALAMAAAVALVVGDVARDREPAAAAPVAAASAYVPVRSTQPLFAEPFARQGGESARIDRIASARAADLRDNRFARWGVR